MARYSKQQRYNIKMAKMANKQAINLAKQNAAAKGRAAKNIIKSVGDTVTSNVAAHYAQKSIEQQSRERIEKARIAADTERAKYQDSYAKSLAAINRAISGGDNDSESGSNQSGSTTNVGGSGSKLGG